MFQREGNHMWEVSEAKDLEFSEKERKVPVPNATGIQRGDKMKWSGAQVLYLLQDLQAVLSTFNILNFNSNALGKP